MQRQTIDKLFDDAFSKNRRLDIWMRHNRDVIERNIEREGGGFSTTMAVIRKARIVTITGRKPKLATVKSTWKAIQATPSAPRVEGEVAPGVRDVTRRERPIATVANQKSVNVETVGTVANQPAITREASSTLELRNSFRPSMPTPVHGRNEIGKGK